MYSLRLYQSLDRQQVLPEQFRLIDSARVHFSRERSNVNLTRYYADAVALIDARVEKKR